MLTLGSLIEKLEAVADKTKVIRPAIGEPHSWRGVYSELAFEPVDESTVEKMLSEAKACDGATFVGYKGGEFVMDMGTEVHIDSYGDYSNGLRAAGLILSIDASVDVEGRTREWLNEKAVDMILAQ